MTNKDLYKAILDSLGKAVLVIDKEGIVIYANKACERISGHKQETIMGKRLQDERPGARLPSVLERKEEVQLIIREEQGYRYAGSLYPVLINGKLEAAVSITDNLDELEYLHQELNKYRQQIKELQNRVKDVQKAKYKLSDIISCDISSKELNRLVEKIANNDTPVLITGESGTGKEMYAQAIHNASSRADESFIAVNCASLQKNLLESELFGYEDASFTGARKGGKIGLFEAANKGTILLDEISELSYDLQAKILRTLQENTIRRIGGFKEIPVDIRIIAATNKNLEDLLSNGTFRKDLYYRIAVFPLNVPPLRERRGDILPIAYSFLKPYENKLKRCIIVTDKAKQALVKYEWPGNIRELRNAIDFSVNMMDDFTIDNKCLPKYIQLKEELNENKITILKEKMKLLEKQEIIKAVHYCGDSVEGKKKAAKALGISISSLYKKLLN